MGEARAVDVLALDAATGRQRWRTPLQEIGTVGTRELATRLCSYRDGVLIFGEYGQKKYGEGVAELVVHAVSAKDGKVLWTRAYCGLSCYHNPWNDNLFVDGLFWLRYDSTPDGLPRRTAPQAILGLDPASGVEKRRIGIPRTATDHRCYSDKGAKNLMFVGSNEVYDVATGKLSHTIPMRGACGQGWLPANGMVYTFPHACQCLAMLNGYFGVAYGSLPAGAAAGSRPDDKPRLEKGPAYGREAPAPAGIAFAVVPEAHRLDAFDEAHKGLWSYTAGSAVAGPPVIHRGLALFGSADGWVYAVRAADGVLAWRLRLAPEDRRIVAFGQVQSTYPVLGGVVLAGRLAYAAAGRHPFVNQGIAICAFDPATGGLAWQRRLCRQDGPLVYTKLAVEGTAIRLVAVSSKQKQAAASFDAATGEPVKQPR